MSTEDLELRDLVTQALESNGVLSRIRAELRASVFLALEDNDLLQNETPLINKTFKAFVKTPEGALLTCLVREFLEYFDLDFTMSVYDPETYHGKDYEYQGRNALVDVLQMKNLNGNKGPLLAQILQAFCNHDDHSVSSISLKKDNAEFKKNDLQADIFKKSTLNNNSEVNVAFESNIEMLSSNNISQLKKEEVNEMPGEKLDKPLISLNDQEVASAPNKIKNFNDKNLDQKLQHQEENSINISNGLLLLSNLPPLLSSNKTTFDSYDETSNIERDINEIKTMINALDTHENNYDEDFQSFASGSGREGLSGKNSVRGSDTEEIEEDIGSAIDDLLSNASGLDDLTVDATISNISGLGDHMENVPVNLSCHKSHIETSEK